jgi:L-amino acid N-acyltransferase YncA
MASIVLETRGGERLNSWPEWETGFFQEEPAITAEAAPRRRTSGIRPLAAEDREPLLTFARALPEEDLLFLDRDITQAAEVETWLEDALQGCLATLVAWEDDAVVGYVTCTRGHTRWTRHVAELRVVVAESARGQGIGRILLQRAFETGLELGVTKVVARMTPEQTAALKLFRQLGFAEEAVLPDQALDFSGLSHDLLVLSFRSHAHPEACCELCGIPVLDGLVLDGANLCSSCYDSRYSELGGG